VLRRAADQAALIGDHALVNALLAAAVRLVDPDETATLVELHTGRHAALFSLGLLEEADDEYATIERLCTTAVERAAAAAVHVPSLTHRNRFAEAISLGPESLRECGIAVPAADRLPAELDQQFEYLWKAPALVHGLFTYGHRRVRRAPARDGRQCRSRPTATRPRRRRRGTWSGMPCRLIRAPRSRPRDRHVRRRSIRNARRAGSGSSRPGPARSPHRSPRPSPTRYCGDHEQGEAGHGDNRGENVASGQGSPPEAVDDRPSHPSSEATGKSLLNHHEPERLTTNQGCLAFAGLT
jgi:hypothetical protein